MPWLHRTERGKSHILRSLSKGLERIQALHGPLTEQSTQLLLLEGRSAQ